MKSSNAPLFEQVIKKLSATIPDNINIVKADVENNFRSILQAMFTKLDLVSREEFDIQANVLAKTREKVEQLEAKIATLENQLLQNK